MRVLGLILVCFVVALPLVGCGSGKDQGVVIGPGQGPSSADIDKKIADVQANTNIPDGAKATQIAQLNAAKARAAAATAGK